MQIRIALLMNILEIAVFFILTILILNEYRKIKAKPILYLAGSMAIFLLVQIIALPSPTRVSVNTAYIGLELMLLGTIYSIMLLIIFFDSFNEETIANKRNIILFSLVSAVETALLYAFLLSTSFTEDINSQPFAEDLSALQGMTIFLLFISVVAAGFMILFLLVVLLHQLKLKINATENLYIKKLLINIRLGGIIILFGPITVDIIISLTLDIVQSDTIVISRVIYPLSAIIGITIIVMNIRKGGLFLLQGEDLRKLLIIANSGLPVYGYSFRSFRKDDADALGEVEEEMLFSGALKSITMLLSEFTGSDKSVQEIKMEGMILLIRTINDEFVAVLIADRSTKFYREALTNFTTSITDLLDKKPIHEAFSNTQIKVANELLESNFGFSYIHQLYETEKI